PAAPAAGEEATPGLRAAGRVDGPAATEETLPGGAKIITLDEVSSDVRPDLQETARYGPLPRIAANGTMPFRAYANPAPPLDRSTPRIAVVIGGMGLSTTGTESAIRTLPEEITLAFAPYGRDLGRLTALARQSGHEILLQVPMEPFDYPSN